MTFHERVRKMKKRFRILKSWHVRTKSDFVFSGNCVQNIKTKQAIIYDWKGLCQGLVLSEPPDFVLHEMLHLALRELVSMDKRKPKELRQAEEMLVQDICRVVYPDKLGSLIS